MCVFTDASSTHWSTVVTHLYLSIDYPFFHDANVLPLFRKNHCFIKIWSKNVLPHYYPFLASNIFVSREMLAEAVDVVDDGTDHIQEEAEVLFTKVYIVEVF